jgi:hypothetical protein
MQHVGQKNSKLLKNNNEKEKEKEKEKRTNIQSSNRLHLNGLCMATSSPKG